ncbi:MAG: hypothetical protein MK135_15465 [Polyangiaceae bacterium]|nr:hypothetical protein [Polyangiaceae bacterium]
MSTQSKGTGEVFKKGEEEPPAAPVHPAKEAGGVPAQCATLCERSMGDCPGGQSMCEKQCRAMFGSEMCRTELDQVMSCMLKLPLSAWECSKVGLLQMRPGHCDTEQGGVIACMARLTRKP